MNVHAPVREAGGSPLPVMVFIHGGGYSAGSSRDFSGQGEGFVRSGRVVYVSFNYRLGALGYLDFTRYSSGRRPFESNLGLRDQVALLGWVQREHRRLRWGCRTRHGVRRVGGRQRGHDAHGDAVGARALRRGHRAEPAARRGLPAAS